MNIINIMNFVRGQEPRMECDLLTPVVEGLRLVNQYGYENTVLLQYDALEREDIVSAIRAEATEKTELGIWIELARTLCESVGIEWNGAPGYDWDWHVNPGFLPAYTQEERKKLIDEIMRKFKETFGYYPKSACSWVLDSFSMQYMADAYDVVFFGICREQYGVDAYTLIGGYFNQGYYPSKYNNQCPAQTKENAVKSPLFRLLGPCPIYNYGSNAFYGAPKYADSTVTKGTLPSIEPVWNRGGSAEGIDWFFHNYFDNESLAFSYMQIGQENSFGWDNYKAGLKIQYDKLKKFKEDGTCRVMKMRDTGTWFRDTFPMTPATSLISDSDPGNLGYDHCVWYDCINYRANIMCEHDKLFIRDIYKFDETYTEAYYDTPCKEWSISYDNLPVMEGFLWRNDDIRHPGIYFDGSLTTFTTEKDGDALVVTTNLGTVRFTETRIEITGSGNLSFRMDKEKSDVTFSGNAILGHHKGTDYRVNVTGCLSEDGVISPENGKIVLDMNL